MNSRYLAGISLGVMACGFAVTLFLPDTFFISLLKGGFEAGLVGGIADWFAVTALFRHPFGIPIPHTSLLLKNRNKIVQSLISAMENELLNKQSIGNKIRKLNLFQAASSAITRLISKRKVRRAILEALAKLLQRLPLEKVVPSIQSGISSYIRDMNLKSSADSLMTSLMSAGYDEKALNFVLTETLAWVRRPDTRSMLGKIASEKLAEVKVGGLMGFAFQAFSGFMDEGKLGPILQNMVVSGIEDLLTEDNPHRETIIREIRVQLFQLAADDDRLVQLKEWAANLAAGEGSGEFLIARLEELRALLLNKLEEDQRTGGRLIVSAYRMITNQLRQYPEELALWEDRLLDYLVGLVEANHYRIGLVVKENLDQLDDASLVNMLEDKVGQDLQWIRVNGALCGFVVGIILSLIQLL